MARDVCYGKRGRISARDFQGQMNTCIYLTLILACINYWQAREIERVVCDCDNVLLYGQYVIDPTLIRTS